MKGLFSLFDLLIIIGLAQGVITSVLLLGSKKNPTSNKFLALAIISFCLLSVKMLFHSLDLRLVPFLRYFPIGVELFIAPLIYFYIVSLITPKFKLRWKDSLHFIPFILSQGYSILVFLLTLGAQTIAEKDSIAESYYFTFIKNTEDRLAVISIAVYLIIGFSKLRNYRDWLSNTTSDNTYPNFNWLKNIFILSAILGLFLLTNLSLDFFLNFKASYYFHWQAYYIFISALIYYLGFVGYMQPNYQFEILESTPSKIKVEQLPNSKSKEVEAALEKALQEDKVFLNPTISLKELAKIIGVSQRILSYVINNSFQKNFKDLINDHRVEEVKTKLNDKDLKHMTILGIALECGFNSEASFYRVFKKNTGLSPKEFIHQAEKSK